MKIKALLAILFSVMLVCSLAIISNAQTSPDKEQKINNQEKDDDGEDDEVSPEERKQVKISAKQARKTALERVSGTIIEEELEKENGRIVYSIEILDKDKKVFDVEVDAETGAIVNVEEENEDDEDDDGEKQKETKKKPPQI
ncbi:MAG: PepSY domain-containing protein [Acidobacteria bacterium]|nr:PepSY domain-containing protein [Acidobacteriota bacterium]MCA1637516.1 PepSY domain-containing protein [Acidobacteriota bacterium]